MYDQIGEYELFIISNTDETCFTFSIFKGQDEIFTKDFEEYSEAKDFYMAEKHRLSLFDANIDKLKVVC